jgi:RND family efflux transporter MFP subunit
MTISTYSLLWGIFLLYSTTALAASPRIPLVVADEARTEAVIKQVPLTGTVTSSKVGRLSSQVSGHVATVNVEIGDHVKTGDVLLQLDREIEQLTLQAVRAATRQARAELADAKRRFESAKRLKKQNSISIDEIENREADVKIREAALQRQLAEEQKQQALVARHTVKASFSGVISEKLTEVGEWIEPGNPVLTLVAIDDLRIDFQVPQDFFIHIGEDSRITVTLDALPDSEFEAKIDAIVPVSDPTARTFLMRVLLDNSDKRAVRMTPGMSVHGTLQLNSGRRGVVVSRDALLRYPDGRVTVWTIQQDGDKAIVSERPVKVGHSFDGRVSILEGVKAGATVVVQGNESLQEGQTVRIHQPR